MSSHRPFRSSHLLQVSFICIVLMAGVLQAQPSVIEKSVTVDGNQTGDNAQAVGFGHLQQGPHELKLGLSRSAPNAKIKESRIRGTSGENLWQPSAIEASKTQHLYKAFLDGNTWSFDPNGFDRQHAVLITGKVEVGGNNDRDGAGNPDFDVAVVGVDIVHDRVSGQHETAGDNSDPNGTQIGLTLVEGFPSLATLRVSDSAPPGTVRLERSNANNLSLSKYPTTNWDTTLEYAYPGDFNAGAVSFLVRGDVVKVGAIRALFVASNPNGSAPEDRLTVTVVADQGSGVNVDIDADGVEEANEIQPGAVVVRNAEGNNAPRVGVTTKTTSNVGTVTLSWPAAKLALYETPTGGNPVGNAGTVTYPVANLPPGFFVQGVGKSTSLGDAKITLSHSTGPKDEVAFTSLWIDLESSHDGNLSNDNAFTPTYVETSYPPGNPGVVNSAIGDPRAFVRSDSMHIGIASEFRGRLLANGYKPNDFGHVVYLRRRSAGIVTEHSVGVVDRFDEPADDTSGVAERDDDPFSTTLLNNQAFASNGVIFDTDGPGPVFDSSVVNESVSMRYNFDYWVEFNGGTRCSRIGQWYSRCSVKSFPTRFDAGATTGAPNAQALGDTTANWVVNRWQHGGVAITSGPGSYKVYRVVSNTANTVTIDKPFDPPLGPGSKYELWSLDAYEVDNTVANDNQNGEGRTRLTRSLGTPQISGVTPSPMPRNPNVDVVINGQNFLPTGGTQIWMERGTDLRVPTKVRRSPLNANRYFATFDLAGAEAGNWQLRVQNQDGSAAVSMQVQVN